MPQVVTCDPISHSVLESRKCESSGSHARSTGDKIKRKANDMSFSAIKSTRSHVCAPACTHRTRMRDRASSLHVTQHWKHFILNIAIASHRWQTSKCHCSIAHRRLTLIRVSSAFHFPFACIFAVDSGSRARVSGVCAHAAKSSVRTMNDKYILCVTASGCRCTSSVCVAKRQY